MSSIHYFKVNLTRVVLLMFCFTSCEITDVIEDDRENEAPYLSVHGYINPDGAQLSVLKVFSGAATDSVSTLKEGLVLLQEDNAVVDTLQLKDNLYITDSNFSSKPDKAYSIKIDAPGLPEIFSNPQFLMRKLSIEDVHTVGDSSINIYLNTTIRKPFDGGGFLKVFRYKNGQNIDQDKYEYFIYDIVPIEPGDTTKKFVVENIELISNDSTTCDSLKLELLCMSSETKQFYRSLEEYESTYSDPYAPRVFPVFSNIHNAYGFWGSYTSSIKYMPINTLINQ